MTLNQTRHNNYGEQGGSQFPLLSHSSIFNVIFITHNNVIFILILIMYNIMCSIKLLFSLQLILESIVFYSSSVDIKQCIWNLWCNMVFVCHLVTKVRTVATAFGITVVLHWWLLALYWGLQTFTYCNSFTEWSHDF